MAAPRAWQATLTAWVLAPVLLLGGVGVGGGGGRAQGLGDGFGRWQDQPRSCRMQLASGQRFTCRMVQLDQRNPLVLRLTLLASGALKGGLQELTWAGELLPTSVPMRCKAGRCELEGPLQLRLVSTSETQFDARGLAQGLPRVWPVTGSCRIDPARIRCDADSGLGERWTAQLTLR